MTTHLTTETVKGESLGGTGSRLDEQGCAKCAAPPSQIASCGPHSQPDMHVCLGLLPMELFLFEYRSGSYDAM